MAVVQATSSQPVAEAPDHRTDDDWHRHLCRTDTSVTGNIETPSFGIIAGWGKYLRDVDIGQCDP
jgi:hypothetical protein